MNDEVEQADTSLTVRNNDAITSDRFLKALEWLIYLEIARLYCIECAVLPILLRSTAINYIRETSLKPHKLTIVVLVNFICILFHTISELPTPVSHGSRMVSGGVLVDFVGEFTITSRWQLVWMDLFLLSIMGLMLLVANEKQKTQHTSKPPQQQERALEEGQVESTDIDTNSEETENPPSETTRMLRVDLKNGFKQILSENNMRNSTASSTSNDQDSLRGFLASLSARANRNDTP